MSQMPPIPVQTIQYAQPIDRRPGIITAMGVISIVVASLSLLASLGSAGYAVAFMAMARFAGNMPPPGVTPAQVAVGVHPASPLQVGPAGIAAPEVRQDIIDAFKLHQHFSEERAVQLDGLLAMAGRDLLDLPDSAAYPAAGVGTQITASGTLYRPTGDGPTFFDLPNGRVELKDDEAVFSSTDGGETRVAIETTRLITTTGSTTMTASGNTMVVTAPPGPTTTAAAAPPPRGMMVGGIMAIAEAVGSLLLAVLLLVAGILVLRDSPKARRLHWIYVIIKIPLVILGTIAWWMLWSGFMSNMGVPVGAAGVGMMIPGTVFGLLALAYPIALIFVLNSRTVREYYYVGVG